MISAVPSLYHVGDIVFQGVHACLKGKVYAVLSAIKDRF